jgi:thioredoxin 1
MAGANLATLNDDNFEAEVLKSPTPVLVDFAQWCGPRPMLPPTIETSPRPTPARSRSAVNVDEAASLASKYASRTSRRCHLPQRHAGTRIVGAKHAANTRPPWTAVNQVADVFLACGTR